MYLSRLSLNSRSPVALRALSDPYAMHELVWSAFPDRDQGGAGRVLFRLEPLAGGRPPIVLVQSDREPAWQTLEQAECLVAECKPFTPEVARGQRLRFRLRANPTVRRVFGEPSPEGGPKQSGVRVGVYGEENQRAWLARKAERSGFTVRECRVTDRGLQESRRRDGSAPLRHLCVDFDGVLEVVDPERFLSAVENGIGSAKGFGFGLLSLARV